MESLSTSGQGGGAPQAAPRVHYLDWLRVLAILMVFVFHSLHVFDFGSWQIKNAEQSEIITIILSLLGLWGMPFFFLVAGAAGWSALQRRSARQYASERFKRLLVPFAFGSLLFSPVQYFLEWMNRTQLGIVSVSFPAFLSQEIPRFDPFLLRFPGFSPKWFPAAGFHLWFVGFLFAFALITLPLFLWLKGEAGKRLVSALAGLCEHRGGILLLILPLLAVQFCLRPFFLLEHDWADFLFRMSFYILGYLLFTDERFASALRRDWWLLFALGTAVVVGLVGIYAGGTPVQTWDQNPSVPEFYVLFGLTTSVAFCYTLTMLFVGMRFLNFANKWLRYGQEAALPFFVLHQPVIVVVGFFVVQWNAGIGLKLAAVVVVSFLTTIGLYEFVVRRFRPLRVLFGMKAGS
jgi:glucans biosynthesis protein C